MVKWNYGRNRRLALQGNLLVRTGNSSQNETTRANHAVRQTDSRGYPSLAAAHSKELAGVYGWDGPNHRRYHRACIVGIRLERAALMKLLLDTHIWLWSVLEPKRLSRRVAKVLASPASEIWISPVSTWEILILHAKGRLTLKPDAKQWIADTMALTSFREAPLTHEVVMSMDNVQMIQNDPADRFLAATANSFGLTLVTADENLIRGRGYSVLANR
jgi:PIN domain nuclease of toxin-antitoxin system